MIYALYLTVPFGEDSVSEVLMSNITFLQVEVSSDVLFNGMGDI